MNLSKLFKICGIPVRIGFGKVRQLKPSANPDIDLVVNGQQMPDVNGYEATRKSVNLIKM
jgi:hypothetical protein